MRAYEITELMESYKDAKVKFSNNEDEHTVDIYLDTFKELTKRNIIAGPDKDIGKWIKAGWDEFKAYVDDAKEKNSNRDVKKKRVNKSSESITLVDNDEYMAVVPLSERSSCYYGKKTNWCVSVVSGENMFDAYVASGKFPVHVFVDDNIFSFVYNFIGDKITEYRDSENKEYSGYMFNSEVVKTEPIVEELKKHESQLMKLSESKRLKDSSTAIYYAINIKSRFEEGEELIAEEFMYSLKYLHACIGYMYVPVIDKALLSDLSKLDDYQGRSSKTAVHIIEEYLNRHYLNNDLPTYADENEMAKRIPKFYIKHMTNMGEVLTEEMFEKMLVYIKDFHNNMSEKDEDGVDLMIYDFDGTNRIIEPLNYIKFLHEQGHDISGYIEKFYSPENIKSVRKNAIVSYISDQGYNVGFSDMLLDNLPSESISFQDVWRIVTHAPNGEYIFALLKPSQLTPEMLYKLGKTNPRIFKVIGEVPQKLKDYMGEEGLEL